MQENIDPQLRTRYKSEQMRKILGSTLASYSQTFYTNGGVRSPFYYESGHAIVFPPCSDTAGTGIETLSQVISQAKPHLHLSDNRCFVFPLVEERGAFLSWGPRRMHWVTLHYDQTTQIATVIDSRPTIVSYWYLSKPIHDFLNIGLQALELPPVKKLNVIYQGVQHDDVHCGPWTATNIEALAEGQSLETLSTLTSQDRDAIVQHHIDRIYHKKKQSYLSTRSLSTDTVSLESDEENAMMQTANPPQEFSDRRERRLSFDSQSDLGEEDDFMHYPAANDGMCDLEQPVGRQASPSPSLSLGRRTVEPVVFQPQSFPAPGFSHQPRPSLTAVSSNQSISSMVSIDIYGSAMVDQEGGLQRKPGISEDVLDQQSSFRLPPDRNANCFHSAAFYVMCMIAMVGVIALAMVLVLCIPSFATSLGVVLGPNTSNLALGAGLVSALSLLTSGLYFFGCQPKREEAPLSNGYSNTNSV